jgi:hypothetical protein
MADKGATVGDALAWKEYLDATHDLPELRYEETEDWAWRRLQRRLKREQRKGGKTDGSQESG